MSGADSSLVAGATATIDGDFRVEAAPGDYTLAVRFVGYQEVTQPVTVTAGETDLGTIGLIADTQALGEVQVRAERTQVAAQIDRTVYNTADDPVAEGGNATDVLTTIPSVDVDIDGNISLRGSGGVAVFINGRPAPVSGEFVASYLASLPAGSIERVEVIPNPSAAFEPDGVGGILNIVLKENTDPGLGGTLTLGTDTQGGYDGSAAVTWGRGPWSLAATYGYRNDARAGGGTGLRINRYLADPTTLVQDETQSRTRTSHLFNLSADYAITPSTTITSQFQVSTRGGDEEELNNTLRTASTGDLLLNYNRLAREADDGLSGDVRLGLRQEFGERHTLTIEGRGDASNESEFQTYNEELLAGVEGIAAPQQVDQDEEERELSLSVDYTRPLAGFRVDLGYKGEWERETSGLAADTMGAGGQFVRDLGVSNTFDYDQTVHALYAQAAREWGAWGLQLGLRAEQAVTTFTLLTDDRSFDNDYRSLFPSAYLSYKPTESLTFRGGYSRRIDRPRSWSLNPFPSFDNRDNIRQGNPALRPEYTDAFEISAAQITNWGSLSITPYYRHTTDVIRRISTLRDDGVTVRTSTNLDTADSWGAEGVLSFENVGGLKGYLSLEGYRLQTEGATADTELSNDAFGWGGRVNANYGFGDRFGWGDLALQATARYSAPIDTEQGRIGARTFIDFALRQKLFGDQASLTLQARDPLGLAGFSYVQDGAELYQEFERDWGAQQIGVTFSYTLGQQSQDRDRDRGGDRGDGGGGDGEEF